MVWEYLSMKEVEHLYRESIYSQERATRRILENYAIPSGQQLIGKEFII